MNVLVLGLQWGDEGKGKAIDYLAGNFDVVARFQGGHNAGHTIYYKGEKVVLHLLPSGIFSPGSVSVIGSGVVVNPLQLVEEIKSVEQLGITLDQLAVSHRSPLILPFHQHLDIAFEQSRYLKIGTTRRGIGPAYEDLIGRRAVFVGDLLDRDLFSRRVSPLNDYYNNIMRMYGASEIPLESYLDDYLNSGRFLQRFLTNTVYLLNRLVSQGKSILFEGAQGTLLDIHHGTYPFVTSSNPTIGGLFTGTGLSPKAVDRVVGITKAYATRVGEGPFPSELFGAEADFLREKGSEYGATTGRPRRVGCLDLVALKYAVMINGVDSIFLTKLDILDEFDEIKVVTAYRLEGEEEESRVFDPSVIARNQLTPLLKTLPGWHQSTGTIRLFQDLPPAVRTYITLIEDYLEIPIKYISVGTHRNQTIKR